MEKGTVAKMYVWEGAIPLQIKLHDSEVTTLPPPPPALILAPRVGYLPLLIQQIRPFFSSTLPPGVDTVWFDYKGLPLKWYIPTGVLFDLLCAEPERPWNLTVHFRGYPVNDLTPCEGEDSVKWSFINSLKEAAYIINGNCKNVMNMSQSDQVDLWRSVMNGNLESYLPISSKLKLGIAGDDYTFNLHSLSSKSRQGSTEADASQPTKTGRIPVRLYVCSFNEDFDDLEDAPGIDSWDKLSYINRPVEIKREAGKYLTLYDAVKSLLPELFPDKSLSDHSMSKVEVEAEEMPSEEVSTTTGVQEIGAKLDEHEELCLVENAEIKLLRVQGIEPKPEIPFAWVLNNLMNPDHFLHICVYIKALDSF